MTLKWILKSYLFEHQQFVQLNLSCSPKQTVKCGVPQDSVLGFFFFFLYKYDLPNDCKLTQFLPFADGISIFYSSVFIDNEWKESKIV